MTDAPSLRDRRSFLKLLSGAAAAAGSGLFFGSYGCAARELPRPDAERVRRAGGLDVTLFVAADTHVGWEDGDRNNRALVASLVDTMNAMPGIALPTEAGGGLVARPQGVVVAGDLTEDGYRSEWDAFYDHFGWRGGEGRLQFPVFESVGNHDHHQGDHVARMVTVRHGGVCYVRDFGDLRMLCLGDGPDGDALAWLRTRLAETGTERPVLVYLHYPLAGPWSTSSAFGKSFRRWQLLHALDGYNVVGIFHGHNHATGAYNLLGYDVYNVGAAKHSSNAFAVVRITDARMTVAAWNWRHARWWWLHDKPINQAPGAVVEPEQLVVFDMPPEQQRRALIPYPLLDKRGG